MPRGDGTGPSGMGSMTGRAAGYCAGYASPGFTNPIGGRMGRGMAWGHGYGLGRGRGGWGRGAVPIAAPYAPSYATMPYGAPTPVQEMEMLRNQAKAMSDELNAIQQRIAELEPDVEKKGK